MSWMDSWSRPSANSKVPAPLYLANEDTPYCHTCGRVMNSKKSAKKQNNNSSSTIIKYCSDRCRNRKPGPLDRRIERTIVALLNADKDSGIEKTAAKTRAVKGDARVIVTCDEVEEIVFGSRFDPEKTHGRRKNRRARGVKEGEGKEWRSVDMVSSDEESESKEEEEGDEGEGERSDDDDDDDESTDGSIPSLDEGGGGGVRIRPPQDQSEVNFSVGGERGKQEKISESADDLERRRQGAKRAEEREMVRRAARREVVFGFEVPRRQEVAIHHHHHHQKKAVKMKGKSRRGEVEEEVEVESSESMMEMRKMEALMAGMVVEPSFAKGNWSVRWRD